jgi:hypothetical protein
VDVNPWDLVVSHANWDTPLTLTPAQCADLVRRWNELIEAKNQVVRDNHHYAIRVFELEGKEKP